MGKKKKQEKQKKLLKAEKGRKKEKAGKQDKAKKAEKTVRARLPEETAKPEIPKTPETFTETDSVQEWKASEVFKALGDENRLQILTLLKDGEICAGDLLKSLSIVQSTLSHHMKILVEAGIVGCRREGKKSWYSINTEMLARVSAYIMKWS